MCRPDIKCEIARDLHIPWVCSMQECSALGSSTGSLGTLRCWTIITRSHGGEERRSKVHQLGRAWLLHSYSDAVAADNIWCCAVTQIGGEMIGTRMAMLAQSTPNCPARGEQAEE